MENESMEDAKEQVNEMSEAYFHHSRPEMLRFVPGGASTILDIGCGAGDFGRMLKTGSRREIWGIELVNEMARRAALNLDRVFAGNIETDEIPLPDGYFDCIICNDVLEHLVDPWRVLSGLRPKLREKGAIVASIPNVRFYPVMKELLINKQLEYGEQGVLDSTHLRFFTVNGVKKLFETSGYRVTTLEGINKYDFSWKFRLMNRVLLNRLEDMRFEQFACVAMVND